VDKLPSSPSSYSSHSSYSSPPPLYPHLTIEQSSFRVIIFQRFLYIHPMSIFKGAKIGKLAIVTLFVSFVSLAISTPTFAATTTDSGYGGGCKINVIPPRHGFSISASPIYRQWWEWWVQPRVSLSIAGGTAYQMMIANSSNFSGGVKQTYSSHATWNVPSPWQQGFKSVYVKFYSSCGNESPAASDRYYYWGW